MGHSLRKVSHSFFFSSLTQRKVSVIQTDVYQSVYFLPIPCNTYYSYENRTIDIKKALHIVRIPVHRILNVYQ